MYGYGSVNAHLWSPEEMVRLIASQISASHEVVVIQARADNAGFLRSAGAVIPVPPGTEPGLTSSAVTVQVVAPPAYPNPPKYAPIPESTETSLLLAPPPRYRRQAHRDDRPCSCDICTSPMAYQRVNDTGDKCSDATVVCLILLNIVVWSTVFVLIAAQALSLMDAGAADSELPFARTESGAWVLGAEQCRSGEVTQAFGRLCALGRCTWTWIDCAGLLRGDLVGPGLP